jgi:rfaE bifunctional protein kinase chain/domain
MSPNKTEQLQLIDRMQNVSILVIGDLMLDHYIWGAAQRLSDEAPVPIVSVSKEEDRLGGAANDLRNLRGLGVQVAIAGVIGSDAEGQRIKSLISETQVQDSCLLVDGTRPTTVKTRVIARNQQVVRIDREDLHPINSKFEQQLISYIDQHLEKYDALIVSEYGKGLYTEAFSEAIVGWRAAGRIGLATRPLILDPHPRNSDIYRYASVVKPNRAEAERALGRKIDSIDNAKDAARILAKKWGAELILLSLSEDGMVIVDASQAGGIHIKTRAVEVADVSGAGDTVTSVFAAALACGAQAQQAGELANLAASIVIAEVGTAAITKGKLQAALRGEQDA